VAMLKYYREQFHKTFYKNTSINVGMNFNH